MMASAKIEPESSTTIFAATAVCRVSEDPGASPADFPDRLSVDCTQHKRRRVACFRESPMKARRKSFRRHHDDRTVTTGTPRNNGRSRRPESARRGATLQEGKGEHLSPRLQLRRRRPRSAMATEYLGVSRIAFPPPLRRYIESPQHGRRALRSSKSSPPKRILYSPSKILRDSTYSDSDCSSIDTWKGGNFDEVAVPQAQLPSGKSPRLLTPVGPGWWETAPSIEPTDQESAKFPTDNSAKEDGSSVESALLTRIKASCPPLQNENDNDNPQYGSGDEPDSQQPASEKSQGNQHTSGATREEGRLGLPAAHSSRRCRRFLRSRAWDLLTGRRMKRGRRKGSRDIQVPEVDTILLDEVSSMPGRSAWEPSHTAPLEYPTSTVRRGVARFHEQVQRTRLMEGKAPLENLPDVQEPANGIRASSVAHRRRVERLPPPLQWPEEKSLVPGDILVTIEHCTECSRHRMSLHHNADVYIQRAAAVKAAVEQALADAGRLSPDGKQGNGQGGRGAAISLQPLPKTSVVATPTSEAWARGGVGRVGAFEVQVTACLLTKQSHFADPRASRRRAAHQSAPTGAIGSAGKVLSSTVSSKLSSGKWPRPDSVASKIVRKLQQWGAFAEHQLPSQQHQEPPPQREDPRDASLTTGGPETNTMVSRGETAASAVHPGHEMHTGEPSPGQTSLGAGQGEGRDDQHPVVAVLSDRKKENATSSGGLPAETNEDGQGEDGISRRSVQSLDTTGLPNARTLLDVADGAGREAMKDGTREAPAAEALETFLLRVEDAVAEGVEFAAEGNTADPCFLLRVGNRKGTKSEPVADVPGGAGGTCRWPSPACEVIGLRKAEVRSSGFEVEIWDNLGWIIARGEVTPGEAGTALDAALVSLAAADTPAAIPKTDTLPPSVVITCALENARGSSGGDQGRVSFGVRVFRPDETLSDRQHGGESTGTAPRGSKAVTGREVLRDVPKLNDSAAGRESTSPGKAALAGISGTAFSDIHELLAFSPRSSGSGSGLAMSSSSSLATTDKSSGSGGIASALGDDFFGDHGSAADDSLDGSWSSAEEQEAAGVVCDRPNSESSVLASPPNPAYSPATPGTARETTHRARGPAPLTGSAGTTAQSQEGVGPLVDRPAQAPMGTDKDFDGGHPATGALPPGRALSSPCDQAAGGVVSSIGSSRTGGGYSDEDFEEGNRREGEGSAAPDAQSIFSFSSTSSTPSMEDGIAGGGDGDGVGKADSAESRQTQRGGLDEKMVAKAAVRLRQRLRRAAMKCSQHERVGVATLFNRLDEDQDGLLNEMELQKAVPSSKGDHPERNRHLMTALVAGLDRVGKRSANLREFEAFLLDANVGAGIEVAALWLRLRRAAIWHRENPPRNDSFARERKKGSPPGQGDEAVEGEERDGSDLGLGGAVNFSNLGERSFKERDLGSSGVVSCEVFREVIGGPGVTVEPPLEGPEIAALCRHFGSAFSSDIGSSHRSAEDQLRRMEASLGDCTVSYRTFLAWIDPVDIGRVAKRVSRFLRAVGDPSSTFRGSIATATASATAAAAEAAAAGLETSGSVGEGLYPTDMPAAIEVTNRGLLGGRTLASGSGKGIGGGRSSGGGGGGGGGSRYGDGGEREKAAERRAIADIFRTVDLDASGHVSQQEFLEVVNGLGLPVTEAEARLLVAEYGGTAAAGVARASSGDAAGRKGGGDSQLSLDDFHRMVSRQTRASCVGTPLTPTTQMRLSEV